MASHLAGSQTEANGATLKLCISCLPNFLKFHKNHRFSSGPLNLLFHCCTIFSEFSNFANFPIFRKFCRFHKNRIFSWGLPSLLFYCFSLIQ